MSLQSGVEKLSEKKLKVKIKYLAIKTKRVMKINLI